MHHTPNKRSKLAMLALMLIPTVLFADEATELKLYRPFAEGSLEKPLIIQTTLQGECSKPSRRLRREDTWQCEAAHITFDPCFIKQYSNRRQAICPKTPWDARAVTLELSHPADNHHRVSLDVSKSFPWAIELSDGMKCLKIPLGTTFEDLPVRYHCANQSQLFGFIQRCKSPWTMLQNSQGFVHTVSIKRAWF